MLLVILCLKIKQQTLDSSMSNSLKCVKYYIWELLKLSENWLEKTQSDLNILKRITNRLKMLLERLKRQNLDGNQIDSKT